jgi:hypothetical protein
MMTSHNLCTHANYNAPDPETKGRSLEELDTIFKDSPSVLGTVKYAKYKPMMSVEEVPYAKTSEHVHEEKV